MLTALLRLPDHLLLRIMALCLSKQALEVILSTFPQPLHSAAVAAATSDGVLKVPYLDAADVLALLPHFAIPSPGLRTMIAPKASANPTANMPSATGSTSPVREALVHNLGVCVLLCPGICTCISVSLCLY